MPLFGDAASPFDDIVERVTSEKNTSENWGLIVEITDKVAGGGHKAAKQCLLALKKRLAHRNPHVVMLALTVLDSCMCNCGQEFRREVCTRDFMAELRAKATLADARQIEEKTRSLLLKWSEEKEISDDASLQLIAATVKELRADGYEFDTAPPAPRKASAPQNAGPDYVSSKEEEDQIAKAIEESLKLSPPPSLTPRNSSSRRTPTRRRRTARRRRRPTARRPATNRSSRRLCPTRR